MARFTLSLLALSALLIPQASATEEALPVQTEEALPVQIVEAARSGASIYVAYRFVNDTGRDIALGHVRCEAYDESGAQLAAHEAAIGSSAGTVALGDLTLHVPNARPGRTACHLQIVRWADASATRPAPAAPAP